MQSLWHRIAAIIMLTILAAAFREPLYAQLISIKTVPVATGDQFLLHPSENLGMGGVSIAIDDALMDPFVNPAKGARIGRSILFTTPAYYSISRDNGASQTLPIGGFATSGSWFGAAEAALQRLENRRSPSFAWMGTTAPSALSEGFSSNAYFYGMAGKRLGGSPLSLAASAFYADLGAVDGVDNLYGYGSTVRQSGHMSDVRFGLAGDLARGRSFEAMLLYNRYRMTHLVTPTWLWWEGDEARLAAAEKNLDYTNTYGIHLGYVHPMNDEWRLGGILTLNTKTHPKIPNYVLMNIPRDPGDTYAFNYGLGVSRAWGESLFGFDLIYAPIWSHTWAEAESPIVTQNGTIPAGGKTVDNHFRFSNTTLRMGLKKRSPRAEFQFGVEARHIRYRMDQYRYTDVYPHGREQTEHWWELTPSVGLAKDFGDFVLRYTGRLTTGTGQPGIASGVTTNDASSDFLLAPSGTLALDGARVWTHQVAVVFALGR